MTLSTFLNGLLPLIGVALGALLTNQFATRAERRRWKYEESIRMRKRREEVYAQFLAHLDSGVVWMAVQRDVSPDIMQALLLAMAEVTLIGSPGVATPAREIVEGFSKVFNATMNDPRAGQWLAHRDALVAHMRADLSPDARA